MRIIEKEDRGNALSRRDPRVRLAAAFGFAMLVVWLEKWSPLVLSLIAAGWVLIRARACNPSTLRRLGEINLFTLFLFVFTPMSVPGTSLVELGRLQWTAEGCAFAGRIAIKANAVMILCSGLLSTMEPATLAHAAQRLGIPRKLAHALFFCVRYLEVCHLEYHRLRNAMKLRAFRPRFNWHSLRSLGYLAGMLFVRSLDRSERILEAMKCRGFNGRLYAFSAFKINLGDMAFAVFAGIVAASLVWMESTSWTV